MNSSGSNPQMQFDYEVQDGIVRSVSVEHEWDRVIYLSPLNGDTMYMAYSILLAQEDCGIKEMMELRALVEAHQDLMRASLAYLIFLWVRATGSGAAAIAGAMEWLLNQRFLGREREKAALPRRRLYRRHERNKIKILLRF